MQGPTSSVLLVGDYVAAAASPGANNDSQDTAGLGQTFNIGSHWTRTDRELMWVCTDATPTAAKWRCLTPKRYRIVNGDGEVHASGAFHESGKFAFKAGGGAPAITVTRPSRLIAYLNTPATSAGGVIQVGLKVDAAILGVDVAGCLFFQGTGEYGWPQGRISHDLPAAGNYDIVAVYKGLTQDVTLSNFWYGSLELEVIEDG